MTTHRTILGGRLRVSTAAIFAAFIAVLALYLAVRPADLVAERTGQLVRLSEAREIVERERERAEEQAATRIRREDEPRPAATPERTAKSRTPAPSATPIERTDPLPGSQDDVPDAPTSPAAPGDSERDALLDLLAPTQPPSADPKSSQSPTSGNILS
ncbi:MAG: hypothetical protein ACT4P1_01380 [Sporichthyaceae bacterium]